MGLPHIKVGFWTFVGSETLFFGSLIATYMAYAGKSLVGPFPHEPWIDVALGRETAGILSILVTSISAFVLLVSSFAMVMALNGFQTDNRGRATSTESTPAPRMATAGRRPMGGPDWPFQTPPFCPIRLWPPN